MKEIWVLLEILELLEDPLLYIIDFLNSCGMH